MRFRFRNRYRGYKIIFIILPLYGFSTAMAGENAADFLRIGVGARPLAMGGAFTALANDASAMYWNPAGVNLHPFISVHVDHVPMFGGVAQYNTAGAMINLSMNTIVGVSWIRLGVDDIPRYPPLQGNRFDRLTKNQFRSDGTAEGYFSDQENAVMVSCNRRLGFDLLLGGGISPIVIPVQLSFGLTGKYIHHKLDNNTGSGQGLDAGILVRFVDRNYIYREPDKWLGMGVTVRDIARTNIIWNTSSNHKDRVQRSIKAGLAASKMFHGLKTRLTLTFDRDFDMKDGYYAGGELRFFKTVAVRGGCFEKNFTAGAGIKLFGLVIDYAFVAHELDNTHRVSGAFYF